MAHVPSAIAITAMRPEEYPLLVEFLYQAIHVSPGTPAPDRSVVELPELRRYIEGFGRPDDACMVARAGLPNGPQIVGAAWARIFPNNSAGYGTIDTATPEVSISLLPDWRNRGIAPPDDGVTGPTANRWSRRSQPLGPAHQRQRPPSLRVAWLHHH